MRPALMQEMKINFSGLLPKTTMSTCLAYDYLILQRDTSGVLNCLFRWKYGIFCLVLELKIALNRRQERPSDAALARISASGQGCRAHSMAWQVMILAVVRLYESGRRSRPATIPATCFSSSLPTELGSRQESRGWEGVPGWEGSRWQHSTTAQVRASHHGLAERRRRLVS